MRTQNQGSPLKLLFASLFLILLAPQARATWSIVVVDRDTGEVCIAAATCLSLDLEEFLPVMRVGVGGACAQSFVDVSGKNRKVIWMGFIEGKTPKEILQELKATDTGHQSRQYGIVNFPNKSIKFTGLGAGDAKKSVADKFGSLRYAIGGNVLVAKKVVDVAEETLLNSEGDLGQRVLAAMLAARDLGGDGRCSCDVFSPESCGAPPEDFVNSALSAFMMVSRIGDVDGICNANKGCGNGDYYMNLNVTSTPPGSDPVLMLADLYDDWRADKLGRPDHILSEVVAGATHLPADGISSMEIVIQLRDINRNLISAQSAVMDLVTMGGEEFLVDVGDMEEIGNGQVRFEVRARDRVGSQSLTVRVHDGEDSILLYPPIEIELETPSPLFAGRRELSASLGGQIPFTLDLGQAAAGEAYILLGSASGTSPGMPLGDALLPLNPDALLAFTRARPGAPHLPGSAGNLDPDGRALAALIAPGDTLGAFAGHRLAFSALTLGTSFAATPAVHVSILH